MPVLEFELTEPPDVITNYVWGVMMFPTDSNRAFEYFVRAQLAGRNIHAAPNTEEITLPVSWVKALVAGDSLEATGKKTIKARREGATAGILLLSAYLYSQTGQPLTL